MKMNDVFESKYLSASDLNGRDARVTIADVEVVRIPGTGEKKAAMTFQGKSKGLILNKTNWNTIAEVLGTDETDDWVGKQITLYPTETEYQGRVVDCLRVRRKKAPAASEWQEPPRETAPTEPPAEFEDIPF